MISKAFPFLSIVVLQFPMLVFMLATPPLLVLKHDTPVDARFIRGLFNLYYIVVMSIAAMGAAGCAFMGKTEVAIAMVGVIFFVFAVRHWMLSRMDKVRAEITRGEAKAVPKFRRLHMAGMLVNFVQLGIIAWGMTRLAA